jgi:uncharacterized membrane protein
MSSNAVTVAVFQSHTMAEDAVRKLANEGVDMRSISIVGKDYHSEESPLGYFNAGDRAKIFGKYGALWGGLIGILFSSLFIFVPVFGHLVILGPLASMVVSTLEGGVVGGAAGALAGALSAIGVPKNSILRYESALKADNFIVTVHGTPEAAEKARKILEPTAKADVSTFAPETASS